MESTPSGIEIKKKSGASRTFQNYYSVTGRRVDVQLFVILYLFVIFNFVTL